MPGAIDHLGRLQGDRRRRAPSWSAQVLEEARRRRHAHHRAELPRRHEPGQRPERHLRRRHGAARDGWRSSARAARSAPRSSTGACARTVGFSAFVSRRLDARRRLGRPDRLPRRRPATARIVIYMESIGDARAFLSAAREVALTKPIIVIKAGRTEAASRGRRLAHRRADRQRRGARRRLPARRRAARRTRSPRCSTWPRCWPSSRGRAGPRLTIVTNAGGPGVLATDALIAGGGELAELSRGRARPPRRGRCPPAWSHGNPIDILGDATPDRYAAGARDRRGGSRAATACW